MVDKALEGLVVVTKEKKPEEQQHEDVHTGPTVTSLQDMYDRFLKLIYVIDCSGSMGEGLAPDDAVNQYKWTKELLAEFRKAMKKQELETIQDFEGNQEDMPPIPVAPDDDEVLKQYIVDNRLDREYGINLPMDYAHMGQTKTKMQAVKEAADRFIRERFEKYPEADVLVLRFEEEAKLVTRGTQHDKVLQAIQLLPDYGGGATAIMPALQRALSECKKRPSNVGAHHIILVSDGLDYRATAVARLVPMMKELGVVLDFIYIVGRNGEEYPDVVEAIKAACTETGGEFSKISTEQDFRQKFFQVSNRKCLPPAR